VLRHTCGSILYKNGWNARQVQLQLGHHSPAFTLAVYVHVLPSDLPEHPGFGGNIVATRPTETDRNPAASAKLVARLSPAVQRAAEAVAVNS